MSQTAVPQLEATAEIAAPPHLVWQLIADPRNMTRWSPQVVKTFLRGGVPKQGAGFLNINRRGPLFWPTQAKIVRMEEDREFAFRVKENYTVWSFELEPTPTGTRVTQRREAPQGISKLSTTLTKRVLGGTETFTAELEAGMAQTLAAIKAEAER